MSDQFFTPCPSDGNCNTPPVVGKPRNLRKNNLVAVVHVGATSVVLTIYTTPDLKCLLATAQDIELQTPQHGWYEQNPEEVISAINNCAMEICQALPNYEFSKSDIKGVAITSQRETTVVWNVRTGKSLYNAIVANDRRATAIAEKITSTLPKGDQNYFKSITGLPITTDCLAVKFCWLRDNIATVKDAISDRSCRIGTMDSWIIWNLSMGSLHVTDVTNASRTLLMNLFTLKWDMKLLKTFCIDIHMLPEIRNCAETFGPITSPLCPLRHAKLSAIIGDQPATLLGQMCLQSGQINVNFNTSCCLLCNTGQKCIISKELLTTVAYKFDGNTSCVYALEGNVRACGQLLDWFRLNLRLLSDRKEAENFAGSVRSTGDVFFVPAFTGFQAPFWRKDARGTLIGLNERTTKLHVVRAALEAICFQNFDIITAMHNTRESQQEVIFVSGSLTNNELLMQMQADIAGVLVVKYNNVDPVAYGAAICAGRAIGAVDMRSLKHSIWRYSIDFETFTPHTKTQARQIRYVKWRRAVSRSVNWTRVPQQNSSYLFMRSISLFSVALTMIVVLVNAFK